MAEEKSEQGRVEVFEARGGSFTVYKADKTSFTISGSTVGCDVRYGSLIITISGEPQKILSPGQWISVNETPV